MRLRIGEWWFEADRRVLRRGGEERRLEPKASAVLERLAREPGAVVAKEELLEAVWPGRYVTEEVLTNAVYLLRRAFGDDARAPEYLETVPRSGYRLSAPVRRVGALRGGASARPGRGRLRVGLAVVGLAALGAGLGLGLVEEPEAERPAPRLVAERLTARGWTLLDDAGPGSVAEAGALAREALAIGPESPDAWALVATVRVRRAASGRASGAEEYRRADRAADRALELEPFHPEALTARARSRWLGSWDWTGAERDLRLALERHPESARPRAALAELLLFSGRPEAARELAAEAVRRNPASIRIRLGAGLVESTVGVPEVAGAHYRAILALAPDHRAASRALAKLEDRPRGGSARPEEPGEGARVDGREELAAVEGLARKERLRPGHLAALFAGAGRAEEALTWLDRAVAERDPTVLFFRFDPRWDPLRRHPRFERAMASIGLPS